MICFVHTTLLDMQDVVTGAPVLVAGPTLTAVHAMHGM